MDTINKRNDVLELKKFSLLKKNVWKQSQHGKCGKPVKK